MTPPTSVGLIPLSARAERQRRCCSRDLTVCLDRDADGRDRRRRGDLRRPPADARDIVYVTVSTGHRRGHRERRAACSAARRAPLGRIGHLSRRPPARHIASHRRCGPAALRLRAVSAASRPFAAGRSLAARLSALPHAAEASTPPRVHGDLRARTIVEQAERCPRQASPVGSVERCPVRRSSWSADRGRGAPPGRTCIAPMRLAIAERAFRAPAGAVRVVPAELGGDVGMLGAVFAARERLSGRGEWFL